MTTTAVTAPDHFPAVALDGGVVLVDAGRALRLLLAAVAARGPGHVYQRRRPAEHIPPSCLYAWEGRPDCLVGVALHAAGVTVETLERMGVIAIPAMNEPGLELTGGARAALSAAQCGQDNGLTWGAALGRALDAAAESGEVSRRDVLDVRAGLDALRMAAL